MSQQRVRPTAFPPPEACPAEFPPTTDPADNNQRPSPNRRRRITTTNGEPAIGLLQEANPCTMNTYAKSACNSSRINTYKIAGLKVVQNQHLQKNRGEGHEREAPGKGRSRGKHVSAVPPRGEVPGKGSFAGKKDGRGRLFGRPSPEPKSTLRAKVPGKGSFRGMQVKSSSFGGKKVGALERSVPGKGSLRGKQVPPGEGRSRGKQVNSCVA
jgi:hypothetical protein